MARLKGVQLFLLCVAAAVVYGVLHDQVTVRLCREYFTVAHRPVEGIEEPTMLALYWGYAATWWVGALLGGPLVLAARAGRRPRLDVADLWRPLLRVLAVMALCALGAGVAGFFLYRQGVATPGGWAPFIPVEKHGWFVVDWYAHSASYASGFLGGIILIAWVWRHRGRLAANASGAVAG